MKKLYSLILIAIVLAACVGCGTHKHSFGEWETKAPAACESAEIEARACDCGEEETREGDPATGHTFTAITAVSKMEKPMAGMVVAVSDLDVTAACECGGNVAVTDGIGIENAALVLGKNTIKVTYGEFSTTVNIDAAKLDMTLDGTVTDDAHISSGSKDKDNSSKKEMGTKVEEFRVYLRVNISEIIRDPLFAQNKETAKVQLILPITGGSVADKTTFKLRVFEPAEGATDADFSKLTWNSADKDAVYGGLNWSNGTVLVDTGVGHNVSSENEQITITLAYSQIADYVDENGNVVFAFATNTDGLKIGSLENKTETNRPAVKIVLNDAHFHVFDQEVAEWTYLASVKCRARVKYYLSCSCGEAGTETFEHGGVINHYYGNLISEQPSTCTTDGVKEHYQCGRCGKYFLYRDGQMKLVTAEDVKLSAGHDYKLIEAQAATCTEAGNNKYFKCAGCGKYFDADKKETTKEAQKIEKLAHSYGELIEQKDATCTEDGVKAHYECSVCHKTFLEKDGEKVAVSTDSLKISGGHDYQKIHSQNDSSCADGGWSTDVYKCKAENCGMYFIKKNGEMVSIADKNSLKNHNLEEVPAKPNCKENGYTEHLACTDCNYTEGKVTLEKIGAHTRGEVIEETASTCTTQGMKKHYVCTVCGKYVPIKADGTEGTATTKKGDLMKKLADHTYGDLIDQKDATCTEAGMKAHYQCSVCHAYFDESQNPTTEEALTIPVSHTYGNLIAQKNATCTEAGMKAYYQCSVCEKYFDENMTETTKEALTIPASHSGNAVNDQGEATCTENGWKNTVYKCGCGKYYIIVSGQQIETTKNEQRITKLGHDYNDETGECTRCGEPES